MFINADGLWMCLLIFFFCARTLWVGNYERCDVNPDLKTRHLLWIRILIGIQILVFSIAILYSLIRFSRNNCCSYSVKYVFTIEKISQIELYFKQILCDEKKKNHKHHYTLNCVIYHWPTRQTLFYLKKIYHSRIWFRDLKIEIRAVKTQIFGF